MQVDVINTEHKKVGTIDLPDEIFGAEVKQALLWEQVRAQRASWRAGTHATKRRGDVSGGGIKPFKQKGTGRARQGSIRAPNHVGGGTVFGPQPRDYSYRLPSSARRAALRSALSARAVAQSIVVLEDFVLSAPSTKAVIAFLQPLDSKSVLLMDCNNETLKRSARNLVRTKFLDAAGLNVYDILNHQKLVLTRSALELVVKKASLLRPAANAAAA
jgi:large subunit ribosomal protein L4